MSSSSMFFEQDFNPSAYVDTLFQNLLPPQHNYSKASLAKLASSISYLTTHLDYYTNEISAGLQEKLDLLNKNSSLLIGTSEEESSGSTRLQYYTNILHNTILTLQTEISDINGEIAAKQEGPNSQNAEAVQALILLKTVKANIARVLEIYEFLSKQTHHLHIAADEFQAVLNDLHDSIRAQLESSPSGDEALVDQINRLIQFSSFFTNLNKFHPTYKRFAAKLAQDLQQYQL